MGEEAMSRDAVGTSARVLANIRVLKPLLDSRQWTSEEDLAAVSTVKVLLAQWALQDRKLRT
jgi:hypothetical protein